MGTTTRSFIDAHDQDMKIRSQVAMKPQSPARLQSKALDALAYTRARHEARLEKCQRIIGYTFKDQKLITEALTPCTSASRRLALTGDRAADLHLATQWYGSDGRLRPVQWQRMKIDLLANTSLASVGWRLRIQQCTLVSCGMENMATTVEAIIGAVWLDSKGDFAALESVMHRFGLASHPLLSRDPLRHPTTTTTTTDQGEIWSNRHLPSRFFDGHHLALLQLMSRQSQLFTVPARHSDLSRCERDGDQATETLPTGMWSRLRSFLFTPRSTADAAPESVPDRPARKHNHHVREPSPGKSTKLPAQYAPSPVLATIKQTDPGRPDESTGCHPEDTEWNRIQHFIRAVVTEPSRKLADRKSLLHRLYGHRHVLASLPDRSLKNISNERSTAGVYLAAHCTDETYDNILSQHIRLMARELRRLNHIKQRRRMQPQESWLRMRVIAQTHKLWRARLELWLPPDAQASEMSTSFPESGPPSPSQPKTPSSDLPKTAAVNSRRSAIVLPSEDHRPERSSPVLWTSNVAQRKSVDWKYYLENSTRANEPTMQSEGRKL